MRCYAAGQVAAGGPADVAAEKSDSSNSCGLRGQRIALSGEPR